MPNKIKLLPSAEWLPIKTGPLIIAGPCSCETREQVIETAEGIREVGKVAMLRAGIWKPRTRPGSFDGVGTVGFEWLLEARELTGLPFAVEVANSTHVEEALRAKVDFIWIGARTTVNPFAVEEIAKALKGVNIGVFVKNPINPDLQLWLGALERLNAVGINKLAAIHRGFSTYNSGQFRNSPCWSIPVQLKCLLPELTMICDPSHIAGKVALVQEVAQQALDLNFDGLMIETHCGPEYALSDADQQLTPLQLSELLTKLVFRTSNLDVAEAHQLEIFREKVDGIDSEIVKLMGMRNEVIKDIAFFKRRNGLSALQVTRWNEVLQHRIAEGQDGGLAEEFIRKLFEVIHDESIRYQTQIMNCDSE